MKTSLFHRDVILLAFQKYLNNELLPVDLQGNEVRKFEKLLIRTQVVESKRKEKKNEV